jgi:hypothetical protein
LKVQPPIVVPDENDRLGVVDELKNAVPVGTALVFQLALALKSNVPGLGPATVARLFQVAFWALAVVPPKLKLALTRPALKSSSASLADAGQAAGSVSREPINEDMIALPQVRQTSLRNDFRRERAVSERIRT